MEKIGDTEAARSPSSVEPAWAALCLPLSRQGPDSFSSVLRMLHFRFPDSSGRGEMKWEGERGPRLAGGLVVARGEPGLGARLWAGVRGGCWGCRRPVRPLPGHVTQHVAWRDVSVRAQRRFPESEN